MRVPLSWLRELVEINIQVESLAERLSMAGFEVESIEDLSINTKGVVVGYVENVDSHPNADKLNVCRINVGQGDLLQIVCGASNIRESIYVPIALPGSFLPIKNLNIKKSSLRGVESNGMVCSLEELGLEDESKGIAILDELFTNKMNPGDNISKSFK